MAKEYSIDVCKALETRFDQQNLHRPFNVQRYDAGTELSYDVTSVSDSTCANVRLSVDRFVGGGFAGQVYRVRILEITSEGITVTNFANLATGSTYAMKILIPPANRAKIFRDLLYAIGFQGPFQLQTNPTAARAGALWQKFIRRAAQVRFGDDAVVNDIHVTFIDHDLGSCGELTDWVDGRTWRLEVDENLDTLTKWRKGKPVDTSRLGSDEYRAKYEFMSQFVELLHEVGAHEFARQYEWSTCKSQPNCLKRTGSQTDNSPTEAGSGLIAVDFRAGLTLLPFLPMSPGDFKLIWQGLKRGSLVQFDRGDIAKLESFVDAHPSEFAGMEGMLGELKKAESIYRNSLPDVTHNHVRLLYSPSLWRTMLESAVTGWRVRNMIDDAVCKKLRASRIKTILFWLLGMLSGLGLLSAVAGVGLGLARLIVPGEEPGWQFFNRISGFWWLFIIGGLIAQNGFRVLRKIRGSSSWRRHYVSLVTNRDYFKRALRGKIAEKVIGWHRAGRVDAVRAKTIAAFPGKFFAHVPFSILHAGLHRFLTDGAYAKKRLGDLFVRPVKLYFDHQMREQWMRDMVTEGRKKHILSEDDAEVVLGQLNEPYIQKYLKSLAVHVCTLPITQVVSVTIALIYVLSHPEMPWKQAWGGGVGIIALFQVIPISPGSVCRGAYTLYMAIRDRSFKDYNIAIFLSFFKYIGYLAFPIQMSYHYPAMARFMAGHWATEAVHIVPVFGERGALLEHWVFCLFYNWPLTIRRRMAKRCRLRQEMKPRYWHVVVCALAGAAVFVAAESMYTSRVGELPTLRGIWYLAFFVPVVCGAVVTIGCGGADLWKRIVAAAACGLGVGMVYTVGTLVLGDGSTAGGVRDIIQFTAFRLFVFSVFATIGAIVTELKLGSPSEVVPSEQTSLE